MIQTNKTLKELLNEIPAHTRLRWKIQMAITEFVWRFHSRRNRWCKECGEFIGNSDFEESRHNTICRLLKLHKE